MNKKIKTIRKKLFENKKFNEFDRILDEMGIPEKYELKDGMPKIFFNNNYKNIEKYNYGEYKKLYKTVKEYVKKKEINGKTIIIVHPFYPILRHANFLIENKTYLLKYIKYEKEILNILKNKNNNIILIDTPDSFARYTYIFYDFGSVKNVIFTRHSTGTILDKNDIKYLSNLNGIIIGCYGKNCIKQIEDQVKDSKFVRYNQLILERAVELNNK